MFAKQGLDVDSADLGGDAKVQQALASGSIDIGLGSGPGLAFVAKGSGSIVEMHATLLLPTAFSPMK